MSDDESEDKSDIRELSQETYQIEHVHVIPEKGNTEDKRTVL